MICIKNGTVYTVTQKEPIEADILIDKGKIYKLGKNLEISASTQVIDATGLRVYPGFVEAHCHLGLHESGIGFEGNDTNEATDPITPQLRGIDAINPFDPTFKEAALAGITCVGTGPGSANVVGGTFCAMKTVGTCVDEMIVKETVAMKCAFGENPKRNYKEKNNNSRMSTAAKLRELLFKTSEYSMMLREAQQDPSKRPAFDMKLNAMLPVIRKQIPLKVHAHRADDICTALRIAKEFGLDMTLEHVTDGHLLVPQLVKANVALAIGPSLHAASKFEVKNMTFETPGILSKAGCKVCIITDAPVIPQNYLPICAGLAIKSGMDSYEALKAITIHAARHLGIEGRVGSLEEGKDADLFLCDGDPLQLFTNIHCTMIDGKIIER